MHSERRRKQPGHKRRDKTVEERRANTDGDQREHIELARDERRPPACEERQSRPQHDRCCQRELKPRRNGRADQMQAEQLASHRQDQQWHGQHR